MTRRGHAPGLGCARSVLVPAHGTYFVCSHTPHARGGWLSRGLAEASSCARPLESGLMITLNTWLGIREHAHAVVREPGMPAYLWVRV